MARDTAPTLVAYYETASYQTGGSPKTVTGVSWNSGDIIVGIAGQENPATYSFSNANLSFSSPASDNVAGYCGTNASYATAASSQTGQTISCTTTDSGGDWWGFSVWVWRGSDGFGQAFHSSGTPSVPSDSVTPTDTHSAFMWGVFDWTNGVLGTIVPTPTNTRQRVAPGSHYTYYVADLVDKTDAATTSFGITSGGSGTRWSVIGIEVLGTTAATPQTIRPDADTTTTGWTTTPLFSKVNDSDDGTVITATLA